MNIFGRIVIVMLGLVLLAAPTAYRIGVLDYPGRSYQPPTNGPQEALAATPEPTPLPAPLAASSGRVDSALGAGPVVVDLAHFNDVSPVALQPLANALAARGVGLRLWLSKVDAMKVEAYLDFPDQSAELAKELADASALIVISPFFLWSPQEIELAERFVADGGRLLLISDPDRFGDFAAVTNVVAEPFGVVFNDDYLYDTETNDANYTHFFQGGFLGQAASLDGARIAFYGGRSISGSVMPLAQSAPTTLSSLRAGVTGFTTVAVAGSAARGAAGRVMALSDLDVLSEPHVQRHDNRLMVELVAGFLADGQRINLVADFPHYLGKSAALAYESQDAIGGDLLLLGAQLQKRLEGATRSLQLTHANALTDTSLLDPGVDLIYLADYQSTAGSTLFTEAGLGLREEVTAPAAAPSATPLLTATTALTATDVITAEVSAGAVMSPTTPATPTIRLILETETGLQLLADQTVTIIQQRAEADTRLILAVLANDAKGLTAGVTRLLNNDLTDCITGSSVTFCPLAAAPTKHESAATTKSDSPKTDAPSSSPRDGGALTILLVDDNQDAAEDEGGEADLYLQALLAAGHRPDLWTTAGDGAPSLGDLEHYSWVIWSNAGYAGGSLTEQELAPLSEYLNLGGAVTLSSLDPLWSTAEDEASTLRDLVVEAGAGSLVEGLPAAAITLPADLPLAIPLTTDVWELPVQVALRRGPTSDDAGAPALLTIADPDGGGRLQISAFSMTWLAPEQAGQLIQNLARGVAAE